MHDCMTVPQYEDFMFQLSREEFNNLKPQIVTSSWDGLRRATPYAFTEQGVAMLSRVLNSPKAIRVNFGIMRAFVRLRRLLTSDEDLGRKQQPADGGITQTTPQADAHPVFLR